MIRLTLLFFILTFIAEGQVFKAGYISHRTRDNEFGQIDIPKKKQVWTVCWFRDTPDSKVVEYSAEEINGFTLLEGKRFISVTLILDGSKQAQFMQILAEGQLNLFKAANGLYIQSADSLFIHINQKDYQSKLKSLLAACPVVQSQVQSINFKAESIERVIRDYNMCIKSGPKMFEPQPTPKRFSVSLFAGLQYTQVTFASPDPLSWFLTQKPFYDQKKFLIGMEVMRDIFNRTQIVSGLAYKQCEFQSTRFNAVTQQVTEIHLGYSEIQVPFGLRYTFFQRPAWSTFVEGGIVIPFVGQVSSTRWEETNSLNTIATNVNQPISQFKKSIQYRAALGATFRLKGMLRAFFNVSGTLGQGQLEVKNNSTQTVDSSFATMTIGVGILY